METLFSRNSGTLLFSYFCNNSCSEFRIMSSQFELFLWMKPEALFQWMNLRCHIEWDIVTSLLAEPEISAPYGATFDTLWFPFYCEFEHAMKFEKLRGQFLVRSNDRLLQNISKWLFQYLMAASLFRFVWWYL